MLSLGNKKSSSKTTTNNNDNRQVNDSAGGQILTGRNARSHSTGGGAIISGGVRASQTISGNGNTITDGGAFNLVGQLVAGVADVGRAQAAASAAMVNRNTQGHEVTKAGEAQAAGMMDGFTSNHGTWAMLAVAALVAFPLISKAVR